jgi:hypothetical protein
MATQRSDGTRANALAGREIVTTVRQTSRAPADVVWDVLADLQGHGAWGAGHGRFGGLTSLEAPAEVASVGTEFTSTGEDRMSRMADRSVLTEADRPTVLEFVTESAMELKRGGKRSDWTVIHRYEIAPAPGGCTVAYVNRVARASALPGALAIFKVPILRAIAKKENEGQAKRGLGALIRTAEERASAHGKER